MSSHNRTRSIGDGPPPWLLLLIAFCTLVLTAAGVWVAAVVALR